MRGDGVADPKSPQVNYWPAQQLAAAVASGHWSSCAVYNEPAFPAGPCNCGGDAPGQPTIPPPG